MCGLFGVLTPTTMPTAGPSLRGVGEMIGMLGCLAEERGRDAAGLAMRRHGAWRVRKWHGEFSLSMDNATEKACEDSTAVIGHTRWATQGGHGLANAGPVLTPRLIGVHNGDIDPWSIPVADAQADELVDASDSRLLFAVLDERAHRTGRGLSVGEAVDVLEQVVGRAALAWSAKADRNARIWLARAGLSPLATGHDSAGRLWWASNPHWLRLLGEEFGLRMNIKLIPEGSIWVAKAEKTKVTVRQIASFKPTVRRSDVVMADRIVWRGFSLADSAADARVLRHRTVPRLSTAASHRLLTGHDDTSWHRPALPIRP